MSHEGWPESLRIIDLRGASAVVQFDGGTLLIDKNGIAISSEPFDPAMKFTRMDLPTDAGKESAGTGTPVKQPWRKP